MATALPIVAILVFAVLGVTYKLSDKFNCDQRYVNLFMFLSAWTVMLAWGLFTGRMDLAWRAVALGATMGSGVYLSVMIFRKACTLGRISTSWTVINLALVVPVAASILIWGEKPDPRHWLGIGLTVVAVLLLGVDIGRAGE